MPKKRSDIEWTGVAAGGFAMVADTFVLKVSETAVSTFVVKMCRDANVTFRAHATDAGRVVGYTLAARPAPDNLPDLALGRNYLAVCYSRIQDLSDNRPLEVTYHDQHVRLLTFGKRPMQRDYMLVLRRSD